MWIILDYESFNVQLCELKNEKDDKMVASTIL